MRVGIHPTPACSGHGLAAGDTVAKDLFNLPPPERLQRYRELATEAEAFASTMITPGSRDGYLTVANHWRELAAQLEKSMHSEQPTTEERHNQE
jgi:hypothetical protein